MALHSRISGSGTDEHPSYCLEAYYFAGEVWLTTSSMSPTNLAFAMQPHQARYLASELVKLADKAEAKTVSEVA